MNINRRIIGLDVIRTTAVLFVIFGHTSFLFNPLINIYILGKLIQVFTSCSEIIAFFGVELFFVLSGFLISNILFDILNGTIDIKLILRNFLLGRWLRTLPNYFLFLLVNYLICSYLITDFKFDIRYVLFLQNLFTVHPLYFKEAWSLSVEEWFYLLFPFITIVLFICCGFNIKTTFFITIVCFIVYSFIAKMIFLQSHLGQHYNFDEYFRKIVIFRFDAIAIGILGFWLSKYYSFKWNKYKLYSLVLSAVLIPISLFIFFSIYKNNFLVYKSNDAIYITVSLFYTTLWAVLILGVFPFLSSFVRFSNNLLNRLFTFLSKISYSLYLCNLPVLIIFKRTIYIQNDSIITTMINLFVYLFILITVSYIIYQYYETPFIRFRNKIIPYYNLKAAHDT